MRIAAWFSLLLSIFAILPSFISGVGIPLIFISQIVGGVAMSSGRVYVCGISALIAIVNLEFLSVFSQEAHERPLYGLIFGAILLSPPLFGFFMYRLREEKRNHPKPNAQ